MTNFIEQVRKANADHEEAELERQKANEALLLEREDQDQRKANAWAEDAAVLCRQKILREAESGKKTSYYGVSSFENDISRLTKLKTDALTALLKADGFSVKWSIESHEPCGSDSYFDRTCYSTYLMIGW